MLYLLRRLCTPVYSLSPSCASVVNFRPGLEALLKLLSLKHQLLAKAHGKNDALRDV